MGTHDIVRVFSCDGAVRYIIIGLLVSAVVGYGLGHGRSRTVSGLIFMVATLAGVFGGALMYLAVNGSCMA